MCVSTKDEIHKERSYITRKSLGLLCSFTLLQWLCHSVTSGSNEHHHSSSRLKIKMLVSGTVVRDVH